MLKKFLDRRQAGKVLARHLEAYKNKKNTLVLALPRGGVPVAYEVAQALKVPLDVFMVRKLGVPGHEELAMGAIATGGTIHFNSDITQALQLTEAAINPVIELEQRELARREALYRGDRALPDFYDKTIILVDDGIATGATIRVAIKALRQLKPASLIVAVPAASYETCQALKSSVDQLICPLQPQDFYAVGNWYEDFSQTTDSEVIELIKKAHQARSGSAQGKMVSISCDDVNLNGILDIPKDAQGLVLFVHGSGSSRLSTRNQYVARALNKANLATLLFDLLTPEEELVDNQTRALRFDIALLTTRLTQVTAWCQKQSIIKHLKIGYFGASTGGAAALRAAAQQTQAIHAIVSRGGRPDLAGESALAQIHTPTLLIVGGNDEVVLELNEQSLRQLSCTKKLEIVPGATHLFEEEGALERVAALARDWFAQYLKIT